MNCLRFGIKSTLHCQFRRLILKLTLTFGFPKFASMFVILPVFLEGLLSLCCIIQASIDLVSLANPAFGDSAEVNLLVLQSHSSRSRAAALAYQTCQSFGNLGWLHFFRSRNLCQVRVKGTFQRWCLCCD